MYKLYNVKRWGSIAPHLVLEELGVPYENVWMTPEQVQKPEFRRISPLGFIPALGLGEGRTITESMAIVALLTARHPGELAPDVSTGEHATYLMWLAFLSSNLYPVISISHWGRAYAHDEGERESVETRAGHESERLFRVIDTKLKEEGPFMLGRIFSAVDLYLFMLTVWARPSELGLLDKCLEIANVAAAVRVRPKLKAALETHGILQAGSGPA
jgi:glutathione S-transferase